MKLKSILAVTLVTAFLFLQFSSVGYCAEASGGIFTTTPNYRYSEQLPWGNETIVIDINYNPAALDYYFYRHLCSPDTIFWVTRTYNAQTGKYTYTLMISSNEPILSYAITTANPDYQANVSTFGSADDAWGRTYTYYYSRQFDNDTSFLFRANKNWSVPSNIELGPGVVLCYNTLWTYPTKDEVQNQQNHNQLMSGIDNGFSRVENALSQNADAIINAGSDIPSLNTDNEWMNDSLSKMNEWLSQMNDFKQQMDDSAEENASNMAQAKSFLTGLFDVIPPSIIAVLTLFLVMIVVVKVVGR